MSLVQRIAPAFLATALWIAFCAYAAEPVRLPTDEEIRKIEAAVPAKPTVQPKRPRKVLVCGVNEAHLPVPFCAKAIEIMAKKTGAFEAVFSNDPAMFEAETLKQFDAVILNNSHTFSPLLPPEFKKMSREEQARARERAKSLQKNLEEFVAGGKGLVGIHGATVGLPEIGNLLGGNFADWPWKGKEPFPVKLDEPDHPLNAAFAGQGFSVLDEGYQFKEPYSREHVRVLMSIDLGKTQDLGKRPDGDYAMGWVKQYGKGRIFYSALGHFPELYWNPQLLRHWLDGIQFALGDLEADAAPRAKK
ncbi:MAG: ThuA domain-containing protein [Candidatus Sumerlaeia bacterium]|nr:ThuA domain-containing protein [Candidatus Sumerlaeia bacterium]